MVQRWAEEVLPEGLWEKTENIPKWFWSDLAGANLWQYLHPPASKMEWRG